MCIVSGLLYSIASHYAIWHGLKATSSLHIKSKFLRHHLDTLDSSKSRRPVIGRNLLVWDSFQKLIWEFFFWYLLEARKNKISLFIAVLIIFCIYWRLTFEFWEQFFFVVSQPFKTNICIFGRFSRKSAENTYVCFERLRDYKKNCSQNSNIRRQYMQNSIQDLSQNRNLRIRCL